MSGDRQPVGTAASYAWSFGKMEFDEGRWQLTVDGRHVELERKPLEVLQYLLRHAGEAVTKDELLSNVWAGRMVVEAVLTNAVGKLRRALGEDTGAVIVTLPRVGYRLEGKISRRAVAHVPPESRLSAGDAVPRRSHWLLEDALARAGDSEVWLARHAKTGQQRVFKFSLDGQRLTGLKREVTVGRLLQAALSERQAFVQVIDWDFEQSPFFVEFEYGGVSLDRWRDADGRGIEHLSLDERLSLFVEAVDAVAAAHAVGVLHKDLKPANLLIYGTPGGWHLRVADFGSSGLFDAGRIDALGITQLGLTQSLAAPSDSGTPLYLAPEVVSGQVPSIGSDMYALGVILYQLIVGDFRRPLAPGWERDVDNELLCEDIAAAANGDPARRLQAASLLAERIRGLNERRQQRALEQAVRARVDAGEKRLARQRARRPWMLAAASLLLVGAISSVILAQRAHRSELRAQGEAERAQTSLHAQTLLNSFLTDDVIGASYPDRNDGRQPTVREAVDIAAARIEERFRGDPGSAGLMHLAVARAYNALAQVEKAEAQYSAAAHLLEQAFGRQDERGIDARLGQSHALIDLGRFDEASKHLQILESRIAGEVHSSVDLRYLLGHTKAYLHERQSDYKAAAIEYRKLIRLGEQDTGLGRDRLLKTRAELGHALLAIGEVVEAEQQLRQALSGLEEIHGRLNSQTIQARQNLVQVLMQTGEQDTALAQIDMLEEDLIQVLGTRHPQLANVNTLRGVALVAENRFDEAALEYGKASILFAETLGQDSPFALNTLQYRGEALRWAGRSAEAVELLQKRLDDAHGIFGDASPAFAEFSIILAMSYLDLGMQEKARALLPGIHIDDGKIAEDVNSQRIPYVRLLEGRLNEAVGHSAAALEKYRASLAALPENSDYSKEVLRRISDVESAG